MSRLVTTFRRYSILIGVLILGLVATQIDFAQAAQLVSKLPFSAIAIAGLAYGVNVVLKAIRWHRMVRQLDMPISLGLSISAFLSGALYGMLTIGRLGELLRVEALLDKTPSRVRALSTCIADRLLDLAFLGSVAILGSARALGLTSGGVALGFALLLVISVLLLGRWLRTRGDPSEQLGLAGRVAERSAFLGRVLGGGKEMLIAIAELLLAPRGLESLLWTIASWTGYFGAVIALAGGLGYQVPLFVIVAATAIAAASAALPISFQGVGTREAAFALVLGPYGVSVTQAATLSLSLLTLLYAVTVPMGLIGVVWRRRYRVAQARAKERPA